MKKKLQRLCALLLSALLLLCSAPALALEHGTYIASVNTYYLNPDTGVTDDGGTKNAALGEGMCRSAVYESALIEVENGKIYVTIRMLLASNIKNTSFTVQQTVGDSGSYKSVSASITAENAANDSKDYRFEVPAANSYIGCSMYVTPMGRDVKFYMQVQSSGATAGSGDFVVSISAAPVAEVAAEAVAQAEQSAPAEQSTPAADPATTAAVEAATTEAPKAAAEAQAVEAETTNAQSEAAAQPEEAQDEADASSTQEAAEIDDSEEEQDSQDMDEQEPQEESAEDVLAENALQLQELSAETQQESDSNGIWFALVAVLVIALIAGGILAWRKRRSA